MPPISLPWPGRQLVQCSRLIGDLPRIPHLAIRPASATQDCCTGRLISHASGQPACKAYISGRRWRLNLPWPLAAEADAESISPYTSTVGMKRRTA